MGNMKVSVIYGFPVWCAKSKKWYMYKSQVKDPLSSKHMPDSLTSLSIRLLNQFPPTGGNFLLPQNP